MTQAEPFKQRLKASVRAWLRATDIWVCAAVLGLLYLFNLCDKPSGREMISSYIGRAAYNGHRWAIRAAVVVDWVMGCFGDKPNHCLRAYLHYKGLDQ